MSYMQNRRRGGKLLHCLSVTDNSAIGVSTLAELETYGLKRPTLIEDATKKDLKGDPALAAAHAVREMVQRRFDNPRRKRAEAYSSYLSGLFAGTLYGGVPPVTLFCPIAGAAVDGGLLLPHASPLVTLDGETQTEARFGLRDTMPETGEVSVMFVLYHGIDERHAGNIMHDFNVFAHPVAEAKVSMLNSNGALTAIVVDAIQEAGVRADRIQRHRPTPGKNQVTSYPCLTAGAAGAVLGRTLTGSLNANVTRLNTKPERHRPCCGNAVCGARAAARHRQSADWSQQAGDLGACRRHLSRHRPAVVGGRMVDNGSGVSDD